MIPDMKLKEHASKDELRELYYECMKSTRLFARVFFPNKFSIPFSDKIHSKIFELLDDDSNQLVAIAAPRGIGKTSILSAFAARQLCYRLKKYIVPISCTAMSALEQSENLKSELTNNENIVKVFGDAKSNNFSKEYWDTVFGSRVRPLGADQQFRGRLFGSSRVDLFLADDLESPERSDNEEQREKRKKWFYSDVLNSVNRHRKDWRVIVVGTILHEDSLLANLLDNKDFASVRLELCDDEFNSNWEEAFSTEEVKILYNQFSNANEVDVFFREYRNLAVPVGEHAAFKKSLFKYYSPTLEKIEDNSDVVFIVVVDPCKKETMQTAESAIVVWGIDIENGLFYFVDYFSEKVTGNALYDEIIRFILKYNAIAIGIETTGLEDWIIEPFKFKVKQRGIFCNIIALKAGRGSARGKGKELRIRGLIPYYEQGKVFHNILKCDRYEVQLLSFPKATRWDIMDAASYLPMMIREGNLIFNTKQRDEITLKSIMPLPKLVRPNYWM